jgi:hypothetical protein
LIRSGEPPKNGAANSKKNQMNLREKNQGLQKWQIGVFN